MIKYYKLRSGFIFFLFLSVYGAIVCNLYILQIYQRDFYVQLGKQQYSLTLKTIPTRACIYDRNNNYLAMNKDSFAAFIIPNELSMVERVERFLKKHFPKALTRLHENPHANFMYIKRRLTQEQRELIEQAAISDIKILKEPSRFYPLMAAAPVIGITDSDNKGLMGIELVTEKQLSGVPSTVSLQKDARSGLFYFAKETKIEGNEGTAVHLTLDSDIQYLAYQELKKNVDVFQASEGAVLVMNPTNGHIIAMVSYPTFDPQVRHNLDLALTKNKVVTEAYELGSVMKVVATLALLEERLVDPDELIDCENTTKGKVNGVSFTTWKAHGLIPFAEVVARSNNIGIAKAALRLGPLLYDHYCRMGFGAKTALQWPGEQAGFVNPPDQWSRPSIVSLSFGYESRATLLQLGQLFCMIANDGVPVKPTLFLNPESSDMQLLYSHDAVTQLKTILENTVTQGTAHRARVEGYRVMGKTGTAIMVIGGNYDPDHCIYTFAGIIEKDDYRRVIVTFIKDAQVGRKVYASSIAVPLFEQVAHDVLLHDMIITKETSDS